MKILKHLNVVVAVLLLTACVIPTWCFSYGPSIYSLTKALAGNGTTEVHASGSSFKKNIGSVVKLSDYSPTFSVLLPLVDGRVFVNQSEAIHLFQYLHHGEFFVQAPENWGIIAVVQLLRFAVVFGSNGKCLDYLQFSDGSITNGSISPKICGTVEPDDSRWEPPKLIGPRSFISETGNMTVEVFIFSSTIHSEWTIREAHHLEKTLAIEISFTAFPLLQKNPVGLPLAGEILETNDVDNSTEIIMSNATESDSDPCNEFPQLWELNLTTTNVSMFKPCHAREPYCLHSSLWCDTILQCGFNPTDFGKDESHHSCEHKNPLKVPHGVLVIVSKNKTRVVVAAPGPGSSPLRIEVIHWIIIGVGTVILVIAIVGVTFAVRHRYCKCPRKRHPSNSTADLDGSGNSGNGTSDDDRERQYVLIDRLLSLHRKSTDQHNRSFNASV